MRKISKDNLSELQLRGKTVIPMERKKEKPKVVKKKTEQSLQAPIEIVIKGMQRENSKVIEAFRKEIKTLVDRPRISWEFTINRDNKGRLKSIRADPV